MKATFQADRFISRYTQRRCAVACQHHELSTVTLSALQGNSPKQQPQALDVLDLTLEAIYDSSKSKNEDGRRGCQQPGLVRLLGRWC